VRFGSDLYTKRIMPWTASLIAGDRSGAYHYLPRSVSTFMQPEAFRRSLQDAGFVPQDARPLTFGICVAHLSAKPGPDGTPAGCGGRCGCC
jgi:demethylmenaquinone methyltransferase/2-methoxy-6-polyprenyl-1,4-benzoquinol methylase